MRDAAVQLETAIRLGHAAHHSSIERRGENRGLLILRVAVHRNQERCLAAVPDRAAQRTFDNLALFGRRCRGERIACIELRCPRDKIQLAFIVLRARLGQNFNPATAWA